MLPLLILPESPGTQEDQRQPVRSWMLIVFVLLVLASGTIVLASVTLSVVASTPTDTAEIHEFFDGRLSIQIPHGYERLEVPEREADVTLVRRGDWAAALARALPEAPYNDQFLEDWFHKDILDYIVIDFVALTDQDDIAASPKEVHRRFAGAFTNRWGEYSFSFFDDETGIGWSVNYAGAYVFLAILKLDDTLIVVEAMDNVETLAMEDRPFPDRAAPVEALWDNFKRAANEETVTMILRSARLVEPSE